MYAIIGILFCLLLGVMIRAQGVLALLWVPLGFAFGLFATAQVVLPILMGLPRAIRLVAKGQMRGAVFGRILVVPIIWLVGLFVVLFFFGFLWPSAAESLYNNAAVNLALCLGTLAIFMSPLSKKARADFREDFDRAYRRYYTKYVDAAITVATNLYLQTIPGAEDAPAALQFKLSDSRFRYLIFCLSTVITAALAYDERKQIQPEELINGCLRCATLLAKQDQFAQEYFDDPASSQDSINSATAYLQEFLKQWSRWPQLEKEGRNAEKWELISSMIRTTESNIPAEKSDTERLSKLALWIDCRLPTMGGAFIELAERMNTLNQTMQDAT